MQAYHLFFIAGCVLLMATPLLLMSLRKPEVKPRTGEEHLRAILAGDEGYSDDREERPLRRHRSRFRIDAWRQVRSESEHLATIAHKLRLAGVNTSRQQMQLVLAASLLALLAAAGATTYMVLQEQTLGKTLGYAIAAPLFTALFLYSQLDRRAQKRQLVIENECLMLIQTMRMLWRVGLSLPKTLTILCGELLTLTPECAKELRIAAQKIEAGQSQDEALFELANNTTSEGFKEFLIILRQESLTGGGIDKALQELYEVLQSRRKTRVQEKVSKTSGNMSIVMMLLLFPALIIVIGGPGFIAISRALAQLTGGL